MQIIRTLLGACAIAGLLAGCNMKERGRLLMSSGPQIDRDYVADYLSAMNTMRMLYHELASETAGPGSACKIKPSLTQATVASDFAVAGGPDSAEEVEEKPATRCVYPKITNATELGEARNLLFAYVDDRCDAYLDAIFWANRSRSGVNRSNSAIGSAATTILSGTGAATNVIGIVAAAFGLSGELSDGYFETVLYGLEPSTVRHLVDQANLQARGNVASKAISSEAALLTQVQDYIRLCTPANLDFLVNTALKKTDLKAVQPQSQATILLWNSCALKPDGTVIGPDGAAYALGADFTTAKCGFTLKDNGIVTVGGKDRDFAGLAQWKKIPKKPADGGGAGAAAAAAAAAAAKPADADGNAGGDQKIPGAEGLQTTRITP